jgi:CubicO group peptidase (beta-lactamase class C family)
MTRSRVAALSVVLLVAAATAAWWVVSRRTEPSKTRTQVIAAIDADLAGLTSRGFSGSVLLCQDGEVWLSKGYGLADRTGRRPITPDTGFDIGSLVKQFTAVASLKLESQGKLHLSDPISTFLPEAPDDKARITVRQLLDHSSGLPDIVDAASEATSYTPDFDYQPVSRDEIASRALHAKLLFTPGTKSAYSNLGYSLLGVIIEVTSGRPYEQYVRENLFLPAGMTRTGYLAPGWKRSELAVGYQKDEPWGTPLDHLWLADGPSWNLRGNGGMLSTTQDLLRWITALEKNKVLSLEQMEKFLKMSVHVNRRGTRTIGPAGSNEIFDACYLWYLDEHRVIIMLTNSDAYRAEEMVPDLARQMRNAH